MAMIETVLLIMVAVLISSVLVQITPRVSSPLMQIGLGIIIALLAWSPLQISLNPDFFLLMFIAPLLYHDARKADKTALWTNRKSVLSLAIGLVVAIMLLVGFSLHWLLPSVPLAAAFALGAALGPTDAVAVASLKREVKMSRREDALLSGEALINDASGVVAFQFAVAAAVTGTYTITEAGLDFLVLFFGGIVLGVVLGALIHFFRDRIRDVGLESNTFHVLLDVVTPFIVYILAELIGVSGILAVVACGIILSSYSDRRIGPSESKLNIVSSSVWETLSFVLNGIVFVLLGMQLPGAFTTIWADPSIDNSLIVGLVLAITVVIVLVRFVWVSIITHSGMDKKTRKDTGERKAFLKSAFAVTLAGPKGAVTLSIMFSTPFLISSGEAFPYRDLLIFLASGVILCTLLIANFVLPILKPSPVNPAAKAFDDTADLRIEILRNVIRRLNADITPETASATRAVIKSFNQRIKDIGSENEDRGADLALRVAIVRREQSYLIDRIDKGDVDPYIAYRFASSLAQREQLLTHSHGRLWYASNVMRHLRTTLRVARKSIRDLLPGVDESEKVAAMRLLKIDCQRDTLQFLEEELASSKSHFPPETLGMMISQCTANIQSLQASAPSITLIAQTSDKMEEVMRIGFSYELQEIQRYYEKDAISHGVAQTMRENVHLMQLDLENRI